MVSCRLLFIIVFIEIIYLPRQNGRRTIALLIHTPSMRMLVGLCCRSKQGWALTAHPFHALRLPEKFPKLVFGLCQGLCIRIACRIRKFNIISIITKGRWAQSICAYVLSESVAYMGRVCAERMHAVFSFQVALSPFELPESAASAKLKLCEHLCLPFAWASTALFTLSAFTWRPNCSYLTLSKISLDTGTPLCPW